MGVGAMAVFIAMVLVAAVAASVLISTANSVREQAMQTGEDAINAVSTGLDLLYISGDVSNNEVTDLHLHMRLAAGSQEIHVDDVIISMTVTGSGSIGSDSPVVPIGEPIIEGRAEFVAHGLSICPGDAVSIRVMPSHGYMTLITFTVPDVLTPGTTILR